ncbi:dnaJ homolog subfamily C member 3 isoform X2 [Harmonia axyridis]|uniref:dnaJ homolog subfamily C member 3 isoform X1 n=1 Tax=Harmonia axyridis TaxID=115357 RepID=UPI001E277C14|nr:dnaJ homolog subfamily C member 3 isoform X1 [Harmonia axyridis]XP_045472219.1 dnaJ homolog subfamily C member 3 isoform X2 [Harmonia axyridis]
MLDFVNNSGMEVYSSLWLKYSPFLALILLKIFVNVSECASQAEINRHLELGKEYLARGQLSDALIHYHSAVDGDPNNYLTYFKRGTVYLALGKAKNALNDLDKVLDLNPDFTPAKMNRGLIHLKQANYDQAQLDFYNVLRTDPYNAEANEYIQRIEPAKERKRAAEYYYGHDDYPNAIQLVTEALETSPWASSLYELRAEMQLANNDFMAAISDIKTTTKLQSDNTEGYLKLSKLLYKVGQATDSLKNIRECLKLDPDHKECFPFYKKVKKIEKFITEAQSALENKEYPDCISNAEKVLKNEKEIPNIMFEGKKLLCTCYTESEQSDEAIQICKEALELVEDVDIYFSRAEAYLQTEMYDDALRDYRRILEIDPHNERAKEGLRKAEQRQKQSEKRDYYKILGVKRSATKKEIVKAYRKMAQKWHPDNYTLDEKMKKIAEKKFVDIAAAKEVLTDEEKRRQFDMGEDPLDPESGKGGMPNFHFQHFHGSPFQFKFHFD